MMCKEVFRWYRKLGMDYCMKSLMARLQGWLVLERSSLLLLEEQKPEAEASAPEAGTFLCVCVSASSLYE